MLRRKLVAERDLVRSGGLSSQAGDGDIIAVADAQVVDDHTHHGGDGIAVTVPRLIVLQQWNATVPETGVERVALEVTADIQLVVLVLHER